MELRCFYVDIVHFQNYDGRSELPVFIYQVKVNVLTLEECTGSMCTLECIHGCVWPFFFLKSDSPVPI